VRYVLDLVGRRILQAIPVMLGVSLIVFSLLSLLPGSAALAILGPGATNAQVAHLSQQLGLNQPFVERYLIWVGHAITGNLGTSLLTNQPVIAEIEQRLPVSFEIMVISYILSLGTAIPVAILAARRPRGIADSINRLFSTVALSVPGFVTALLLILVFSVKLGLLPTEGFVPLAHGLVPNVKSLILPSASVSVGLFANYSRILRSDMIDQLRNEDYVLTARAKGIGQWRILFLHVAKNSLFPLITVVGTNFGYLIGGVVVVENVFGLPGMGQLMQYSILNRDYTVVQGEVILIAVAVILMNLVTDLAYIFLDPRVRYGATGN